MRHVASKRWAAKARRQGRAACLASRANTFRDLDNIMHAIFEFEWSLRNSLVQPTNRYPEQRAWELYEPAFREGWQQVEQTLP